MARNHYCRRRVKRLDKGLLRKPVAAPAEFEVGHFVINRPIVERTYSRCICEQVKRALEMILGGLVPLQLCEYMTQARINCGSNLWRRFRVNQFQSTIAPLFGLGQFLCKNIGCSETLIQLRQDLAIEGCILKLFDSAAEVAGGDIRLIAVQVYPAEFLEKVGSIDRSVRVGIESRKTLADGVLSGCEPALKPACRA